MRWPPACLLGALLLSACHARRIPEPDLGLHPAEAWLVHQGEATAPMALVQDDTAHGNRLLRTPSLAVDPADPDLPLLAARMRATLEAQKGVGIAAPQVGVLRRVIWVQRQDLEGSPFQLYLNPLILGATEEQVTGWEGCLSVPAGYGQVERPTGITVSWWDGEGRVHQEQVEGWTARIFQHEIDHLDGVLFTDRTVTSPLMDKAAYRAMREAEKAAAP